jgi:hypothetical protein
MEICLILSWSLIRSCDSCPHVLGCLQHHLDRWKHVVPSFRRKTVSCSFRTRGCLLSNAPSPLTPSRIYQQAKRTATYCAWGLSGEDNPPREVCTSHSVGFPLSLARVQRSALMMLCYFVQPNSRRLERRIYLGVQPWFHVDVRYEIRVRGDGVGTVPSKVFPLKSLCVAAQ